jgi:hypothetical protein
MTFRFAPAGFVIQPHRRIANAAGAGVILLWTFGKKRWERGGGRFTESASFTVEESLLKDRFSWSSESFDYAQDKTRFALHQTRNLYRNSKFRYSGTRIAQDAIHATDIFNDMGDIAK